MLSDIRFGDYAITQIIICFFRLDLQDKIDMCMKISVIENTKKRNASVPKYVPNVSTLRHIFTTCLDIREPPKKVKTNKKFGVVGRFTGLLHCTKLCFCESFFS